MLEKFKANFLFEKLLRRPDITKAYAMVPPTDSWYDTITTVHDSLAAIQNLPHEVIEITSHEGLKLKAVYYPGTSDATVICIHGYTSHAEREWAFPGLFYHSLGYNVLIPYQRAHGISEGKYISFGALEHIDMLRWIERVNKIHPTGQIVIHGLSMGGGIVLDLAGKEMKNVKCLISDAPSKSIVGFFRNNSNRVFKKDGERVLPFVLERFRKEFSADAADFDRLENIAACRYPLMLSAGELEKREELFRNMAERNPQQTSIVILSGCSHGNGMYKQTEFYQSKIKEFIEKNLDQ